VVDDIPDGVNPTNPGDGDEVFEMGSEESAMAAAA